MTNGTKFPSTSWYREKLQRVLRPLGYALLGYALFQWFGRSSSGPQVDSSAAEFSLANVAQPNEPITLAGLRGNPAVIEVFASWCSACRSMAPTMAELAKAPRKREVHFLGVAVDTPRDEALTMHRDWGIPFAVALADPAFSANYKIKVLPTLILLDSDGRVRHVTTGSTRASTIDGWLADLGAPRTQP